MGEREGEILMEYTLKEYRTVTRYDGQLKEGYHAIEDMIESPEYQALADSTLDRTAKQLMFLIAKEIGYMESLKEDILIHIRNE